MSPKVPLPPIGGGVDESRAPGEQAPGTVMLGRNVRGEDPGSGRRVWGAQRAGLEKLGNDLPGGGAARHFTTASKLVAAREFRSLGLEPLSGTTPDRVGFAWQSRLGDHVLDVDVGIDGQGYFLLRSGDVAIVNRRGKEVDRIPSAAPRKFTPVPRIFASEDGSVYVASTREEPFEGGAGRIHRWVRGVDKTWSLTGTSIIEGRISTFVQGYGVLYVHEDPPADEEGELPPPALSRVSVPFLGDPISRETVVPRPCFGLALSPTGHVFVSAPSNPERSGGENVFFTDRNVGFVPNELPTFSLGNVYSWIDARACNDEGDVLEEGEEIFRMRDKRREPSSFDPLDEDIPTRELVRSGSGLLRPPTWNAEAFGGVGGVRFDLDRALVSRPVTDLADVATHRALLPTSFAPWAMVMLVEFSSEQALATGLRRILSQRTPIAAQPDWVMTADALAVQLSDLSSAGMSQSGIGTTAAPARTALLTFELRAPGDVMSVRVNGADVAAGSAFPRMDQGGEYTMPGTSVPFSGPYTVLGGGRPSTLSLVDRSVAKARNSLGNENHETREVVNGNNQNGGFRMRSGSSLRGQITVDLGSSVAFDSMSIWYSPAESGPAETLWVRVGDDSTFTTNSFDQTFYISQEHGRQRLSINLRDVTGNPDRYINVRPQGGGLHLIEVEVHRQDVQDVDFSAEFNLAEMILFKNVSAASNFERNEIEGYIAHRWGVAHTLDPAHPRAGAGNYLPGLGDDSADQNTALVAAKLNSPLPLLAKYDPNLRPVAAFAGAGVGCGAVWQDEKIYAVGEARPGEPASVPHFGTSATRFKDEPRALDRQAALDDGAFSIDRRPTALEVGPCASLYAATPAGLHSINGLALEHEYLLPTIGEAFRAVPAGLQLDATLQGGDCGPEFLFSAIRGVEGAGRIDTLGLFDNEQEAGRTTELLVVTSMGDVVRREPGGDWDTVEAGALLGARPASATLFGKTVFADGVGYRVYDHQLRQLRDFEEAVSGDFPPRCKYIAAYRGRLVLAGGDNAFTIYQSRHGDPFDFEFGTDIQSIAQAVAGTTSSQGSVPEPITALMPFRNEALYVGTTESLWVITGDLADGGRLDHIDKSQGVAPGYAWCESPLGIYYFSGRGGVMLLQGAAAVPVSDPVARRLEEVDLALNRIEMAYNWVDKTVHVYIISKTDTPGAEHFVFSERTRAWFIDEFGDEYERGVTAAASISGETPEDRALLIGMVDGGVYRWDQYAGDDAGRPIKSSAVVGPLVPSAQATEVRVRGLHAQLDSRKGSVGVATRAADSADAPGPPSEFREVRPGRGAGVPLGASAPAVFIEVQGRGSAWAVHSARVEVERVGEARRIK